MSFWCYGVIGVIYFFLDGLYNARWVHALQMDGFTCSSSANVRNYNDPTGMKGGGRTKCSRERRLVTAPHP